MSYPADLRGQLSPTIVWNLVILAPPSGGQIKRRATRIGPNAVGSGIFGRILNFDKCRSQGAGDAISGVVVEQFGLDLRATFGISGLYNGRIIWLWPTRPVLRITFVQYLIAFYSRQEETSDVISGSFVGPVNPDNDVKFGHPRRNLSREIPPEAVWGGIFNGFFAVASERK